MKTLSRDQPIENRSETEPRTELTPVIGQGSSAAAEVTTEGERMLSAVAGLSALLISLTCIVGGDGLNAVNLALLHVSFAGIFVAARAANTGAKGSQARLAGVLSIMALSVITWEALRQDWSARLASPIEEESCDPADEGTYSLCSNASQDENLGGHYSYNDDPFLGKVVRVLIEGEWRSSRLSLVRFWGWASMAAYMVLVEALPVLLHPLHSYFRSVEQLHNVLLSLTSLAMLVGIIHACMTSGKTSSVHDMLCLRFDDSDPVFYITSRTFFWSKAWEWLDTALLVAKGKPVSWLHYTHHASTTFGTAFNMVPTANAMWSIVCASNSFVHTWMYAYYAMPRFKPLRRTRRWLTRAQIFQHVVVLISALYVLHQLLSGRECYNSKGPLYVGLGLYFSYLIFFSLFYWRVYLIKKKSKAVGQGK